MFSTEPTIKPCIRPVWPSKLGLEDLLDWVVFFFHQPKPSKYLIGSCPNHFLDYELEGPGTPAKGGQFLTCKGHISIHSPELGASSWTAWTISASVAFSLAKSLMISLKTHDAPETRKRVGWSWEVKGRWAANYRDHHRPTGYDPRKWVEASMISHII